MREASGPIRSIAFVDFLIGLGILFVLEGILFEDRHLATRYHQPRHLNQAVGTMAERTIRNSPQV